MRALAAIACLVLAPSVASARSVVVVVGEGPTPVEMRAHVIEAIAERGVRLVRIPDMEVCEGDPEGCAAELASQTGADATLRADFVDGEPPRVRIRLVPPEGEAVDVEEPVEGDDVAAAVRAAVGRALDAATPAVGFLVVRSEPPGARVEVDGVEQGRTPLRLTLTPGTHDVRLSGPGGDRETTVEVVAEEEVTLAPEPTEDDPEVDEEEDPPAPGPTRTEASPFNWIIGGALAIGGVVTLISPLSTLAREGQCEEAIEDVGCVEMVRFGPQSGVLLGVGLALLVAAVVFDAVAPIRVEVSATPDSAYLGVRGAF